MRPRPLACALATVLLLAGCVEDAGGLLDRTSDEAGPLVVDASGPASVSVGATARFHADAPDVPPGSAFWFWDFGDGVEHEGVDLRAVEHTFTEAGGYDVTITVVDADGNRGVDRVRVGVDQSYAFEGTVSSTSLFGAPEYAAEFPVRDGLAGVRVQVTLERPSPAFAVLEPTPPEVVLRVSVGEGDARIVLLEERIVVDDAPVSLLLEAPAEGLPADVDGGVVEVVAGSGSTHFALDLTTRYA